MHLTKICCGTSVVLSVPIILSFHKNSEFEHVSEKKEYSMRKRGMEKGLNPSFSATSCVIYGKTTEILESSQFQNEGKILVSFSLCFV